MSRANGAEVGEGTVKRVAVGDAAGTVRDPPFEQAAREAATSAVNNQRTLFLITIFSLYRRPHV
jgi:hypothetical protein